MANEFLRRLLATPGPSGYEGAVARVWRAEASTFADEVTHDVLGNSYARLRRDGGPIVIIEGHVDEIGLQITHVDPEGFLWFDQIGGWDDQVLVGQRVRIGSTEGDVLGVIGRKARHLMKPEDREKAVKTSDLWIDIGAASRTDAFRRVAIGDAAVIDGDLVELSDDLWVSRALDNRVGAFVALEALRILAAERPVADVYAVAATQEETSFAGAFVATFRLAPAVAIAIDVTHATDYPEADKKRNDEVKLGGGPVLSRGASLNPVAFLALRDTARQLGIDCPVQGSPSASWTDADAMIRSGAGMATALVSIPNRYMHSPNEMVSLRDLEAAARLIAAFVQSISADSDFRP